MSTKTENKVRAWRIAASVLEARIGELSPEEAAEPCERHLSTAVVPALRRRADIIEQRSTHRSRRDRVDS